MVETVDGVGGGVVGIVVVVELVVGGLVVVVVDDVVEVVVVDTVAAVDAVVGAVDVVAAVVAVVDAVDVGRVVVVVDPVVELGEVVVDSTVEVVPAPVLEADVVEPPDDVVVVVIEYSESTGPSPGSSGVDPFSQATPSLSRSRLSRYPGSPSRIGVAPAAAASAQLS